MRLLSLFALIFSLTTFAAQENEPYTYAAGIPSERVIGPEICRDTALSKLMHYKNENQGPLLHTFRLIDIDARFFNPFHYAWYQLEFRRVDNSTFTVTTLVQLNRFTGNCY